MWANISKDLALFAGCILLIGTGVGLAAGFTTAVKGALTIAGAATILGLTAAKVAEAAQKLSVFEQVIEILKEIKEQLTQLSQRHSQIRGMAGELRMDDRKEFLDILRVTQTEVDNGFKSFSRF